MVFNRLFGVRRNSNLSTLSVIHLFGQQEIHFCFYRVAFYSNNNIDSTAMGLQFRRFSPFPHASIRLALWYAKVSATMRWCWGPPDHVHRSSKKPYSQQRVSAQLHAFRLLLFLVHFAT